MIRDTQESKDPTMQESLTSEQWSEIDSSILAGNILQALQSIRKHTGIGIKDAIDINHARYEHLRQIRPDEFKIPDDEYWKECKS